MLERLRRIGRKNVETPRKPTVLENEIEACLSFLESTEKRDEGTPPTRLKSVHAGRYTVGRQDGGYFWESQDKAIHIIDGKTISDEQSADIIKDMHTFSFPYKAHLERIGKIHS